MVGLLVGVFDLHIQGFHPGCSRLATYGTMKQGRETGEEKLIYP
jgi:hypothetical protein